MRRWPVAGRPCAVLFDLDGTLVDTAPDMIAALNVICAEERLPAVAYETARPQVSNGAAGLLRLRFPDFQPERHSDLHRRYLARYAEGLAGESRLFPGMEELLIELETAAVPWGVVTNKPRHLTEPLLAALALLDRSACTVSGDSLPERKPHPRPILFALEQMSVDPHLAVYVGDARRDIESGRAAGTHTVAVRYGYVEPGQDPASWGADQVVTTPADLNALIRGYLQSS